MLEPPNLPISDLETCLQTEYGLPIRQIDFLPLGADPQTAVFRAATVGGTNYFLKVRRGPFNLLTLRFPKWLRDLGMEQIIAPLATGTGHLHTMLRGYKVVLYPFVEGRNGYRVGLSETQWRSFGATLRCLHTAELPADLRDAFPRETFSAKWREAVRRYLERARHERFEEPVARQVASLLLAKRAQIQAFVDRADGLARALATQPPPFVACHADLHAGNLHLAAGDAVYLVDWDTLTLAPKERDLMFIGGALMGGHRPPEEEETLFYTGYGDADPNYEALAYFRYERIIQDIAAYCEQLLDSDEGGEDRPQSLVYLKSNFEPGGTLEQAYRSDRTH